MKSRKCLQNQLTADKTAIYMDFCLLPVLPGL
jgi:hypothetical protein